MERGIKKCEICGNERELLESEVSKRIICKNCLVDTVFNSLEGIEDRKRKR